MKRVDCSASTYSKVMVIFAVRLVFLKNSRCTTLITISFFSSVYNSVLDLQCSDTPLIQMRV